MKKNMADTPKLQVYMECHDCSPLLDYLIALQLNPQNHGKNLRKELTDRTFSATGCVALG